jgi:hypothetical protein
MASKSRLVVTHADPDVRSAVGQVRSPVQFTRSGVAPGCSSNNQAAGVIRADTSLWRGTSCYRQAVTGRGLCHGRSVTMRPQVRRARALRALAP